ncbi:MAG: hypothetical protein A3K19_10180 [Lentisphaerae bacterium RIFOXYB12_FULL_65_16]|nr:MAG: hypothetical protein A3K18_27660 [Lentisphaerae bacterium RIFOXYA12_64_32]OGV91314.1 MAG: hypothetical protein A3K19_10180 [Lentisphaerae bacterium RIFOXYB12_FULL_65_16]
MNFIPLRVLIVEDSAEDALQVTRELKRAGYQVEFERVTAAENMAVALHRCAWDAVLADHSMPGFDGLTAFRTLTQSQLDIPFILLSAKMPEEKAAEFMRLGVRDCILKSNVGRLVPVLARELRDAEVRRKRREAEEALRDTNEKLRVLVSSSPSAIITWDPAGTVTMWNAAATRLFGWNENEVIGRPNPITVGTEDAVQFDRLFAEKWQEMTVIDIEMQCATRHGTLIAISLRAAPLRNRNGEAVGVMGIASDITERKRVENHREDLIRELEAKNAELERFTYAVSHDLKSPLITVKGFLSLIEHEAMAGEYANLPNYIERVNRASDKMSDLLDDLLQLSRAGRFTHPPEEVRLDVLVRDVLDMLSGRIATQKAQVTVSGQLPAVQAVRPRLSQVLENLIDNAVKFARPGSEPRIEIGAQPREDDVVIFVRDDGIGVNPKDQQRVFDLFDKLDPKTEGSGIGLALAKRIVESHGGRIWVESEGQGRGSTFFFTLPHTPVHPDPGPSPSCSRETTSKDTTRA